MEEKKAYAVFGTVTIGTDEYRDLLEDKFKAEKQSDYYMREGWKKDDEIKKLKSQVDAMKAKIDKCEKFMKKNLTEDKEDTIAMFIMSLFGEE